MRKRNYIAAVKLASSETVAFMVDKASVCYIGFSAYQLILK